MSDIKTCEQYVLSQLFETENKLQTALERIDELEEMKHEFEELKGFISTNAKSVLSDTINQTYITFNNVWDDDDGWDVVSKYVKADVPVINEEEDK